MKHYKTKKRKIRKAKIETCIILIAISASSLVIGVSAKSLENSINTPNIPKVVIKTQDKPILALEGTIRGVTMYNAGRPEQTDNSPCITANGENVCTALALGFKRCAANFVPLGTDLYIENYGECKVTDRMNSRFVNRVDIAVTANELERATNFGLQYLKVIVK